MIIDFKQLEGVLKSVERPGRYIGHEFNTIVKDPESVDVRIGLVFPDVYELGMSYEGFQILYHILNRMSYVLAERAFSPWPDFEAHLRSRNVPLFSCESKTSLCSFDIIAFTVQYELHATNILNALDLSGVPVFASERTETDPFVIAGGPCVFNPEPFYAFVDAFVIGDGEEVVTEMVDAYREGKKHHAAREEILLKWAKIPGIYVPKFYQDFYDEGGRFKALQPLLKEIPRTIRARVLPQLEPKNYPEKPVVPLIRVTHDRLSVEVMRGCTRGCRFCHAGFIYRPTRERSQQELVDYILKALDATGYEEVSLVSLSTSDYSALGELWFTLKKELEKRHVSLSLPSLRPETITPELLRSLKAEKKSGLTLAPEAGTDRLRRVINKFMPEEDILRAVETAFQEGWRRVKLYFMIGLPTETERDLAGIVELVRKILQIGKKYGSAGIRVSISPFSPKPHTPFQWMAQDSVALFEQKIRFLIHNLPQKNVKMNYRDPRVSFLEDVLSRGDRRLSTAIVKAWQNGAGFDAWTDHFNWGAWQKAFEETGIDPERVTRERREDEPLPWDHIVKGITKKYLRQEYVRALSGAITADCKYTVCNLCGLMHLPGCRDVLKRGTRETASTSDEMLIDRALHPIYHWKKDIPENSEAGRASASRAEPIGEACWYRLSYEKRGLVRFLGHLDLLNMVLRAFRRLKLPLVYSRGFSPHPRISPGPPLALGFESLTEYLDVQLTGEEFENLPESLNGILPEGLRFLAVKKFSGRPEAIASLLDETGYTVYFGEKFPSDPSVFSDFMNRAEVEVIRFHKKKSERLDIRPFVKALQFDEKTKSLRVETRCINGKTVKLKELFSALFTERPDYFAESTVIRTGLWALRSGKRLTPMEV